ncbi:iron-sulfur cluster assembly scaffold protein [Patescibacteria group bacterium]|nr:iron-sulfur cluster assembly scaffold protein [Patescibacteria group bacterium]
MSTETDILIKEYTKNPINNFPMENYSIKQHEGNFICGDDITVYLVIEKDKIKEYSFDGNCTGITTAAASFLSEFIIGSDIQDVLTRSYETMK